MAKEGKQVDSKTIAAYIGALIAIGIGAALLWFPPQGLASQAATVGLAVGFITGGLAAVGVTVSVPAVRESARREALAGRRASRAKKPTE
jgi:hypothetical protein